MQPRVGFHVACTIFLAAFAGAGMTQNLTIFAVLCGPAAVLVWVWYIHRRQCARDMIDNAIAVMGADALAEDFAHAEPYELKLLLGRLMAYHLEGRLLLPLSSLRELRIEDTWRSRAGDRSERATHIICMDENGERCHLVTMFHHSPLFLPLIAQILTDVPSCALLYDVNDSVAEFAQEMCAWLCRTKPEAGFIRQHDASKRLYGISKTLHAGFTPFGSPASAADAQGGTNP